ncbi:MAG TPA: hypothetical protein VE028_01025 [Nitratidesulfovibrio sp.]|nr:hypothetical protein [Nitratidesulfovibrio sp.]
MEEELRAEAEELAKQLNKTPEEIFELCASILSNSHGASKGCSIAMSCEALKEKQEELKKNMQLRGRRTHGSIKFPI